MSMDTIMEDSDYSVSNTDAIICHSSDISGWTESLISDPNIPNSSSTSEDEYQQQQISTAAGGGGTDDLMITVSSSGESSRSTNNNKLSEQNIRIFNVDFRKFSSSSSPSSSSARQLHECSICGLEFLTRQALGGHMRRHRAIITSEIIQVHHAVKQSNSRRILSLDLNLTPLENDLDFLLGKHTPVVSLFL